MPCHAQLTGPKTRYSDNATLTREGTFVLSPAVTDRAIRFALRRETSTAPQLRLVALRYVTYKRLCIYRRVSHPLYRQLDIGALPALPCLADWPSRIERDSHWQERRIFSS
jgi:hypothetical protein